MGMTWLPEPPPRTRVCLAFDGSDVSDHTAIRAETIDGFQFTPRFGGEPTIWNPDDHPGGRIPRLEVSAAVSELFARFDVERMYCDPPLWATEIEMWANEFGEKRVTEWPTYRPLPMYDAIERFVTDLTSGRIRHDGCPITAQHIANARISKRKDGRYMLAKPDTDRKIDAAVTSVLAHEAASRARADGWSTTPVDTRVFSF